MIQLSDRLSKISASPTLEIARKTAELISKGIDVIDCSMGELNFPTPETIKAAGKNAIEENLTRYTAVGGIHALKQVIIDKFKRDQNCDFNANEIIVSNGAKQVIFNAFMCTLNPEDEVIIPVPYWVSYPEMVNIAGGKSICVSTNSDFSINFEEIEEYVTPRTKWLIYNVPSNPTGVVHGEDQLKELKLFLEKHPHICLLSDEIYEDLYFDVPPISPIKYMPEFKERILTVNGVSKSYAMTGWRIGYAGGARDLIQAMHNLQSHSTSSPSTISQYAALQALTAPHPHIQEWRKDLKERRDLVDHYLKSLPLNYVLPQAGFYFFVDSKRLMGLSTPKKIILNDELDIIKYLLESGIAVAPGRNFGRPVFFRFSFAMDIHILEKALERLKGAILALKQF